MRATAATSSAPPVCTYAGAFCVLHCLQYTHHLAVAQLHQRQSQHLQLVQLQEAHQGRCHADGAEQIQRDTVRRHPVTHVNTRTALNNVPCGLP